MSYLKDKSFFFESSATDTVTGKPYSFSVVNFSGAEEISRLYEFEITLVSNEMDINIDAILSNPATLYLKPGNRLPVHGIISKFEQLNEVDGNVFYKATLVPKLYKLTLYKMSEVYLDLTVPEIIEKVLNECTLTAPTDYELKLFRDVPTGADPADYRKGWRVWPYISQYQESHFDFISRWMEREGIYYYFDQTDTSDEKQSGTGEEKLIITNTYLSHDQQRGRGKIFYSPPSIAEVDETRRPATSFICRQKMLPARLILQDVNYRKTSSVISGQAPVSPTGQGEVYIHGEHLQSNEEANQYAQIRAEELLCRQKIFIGETMVPQLRVGFYVTLERHYRQSFNEKYLVLGINHEGSQASLLTAGVASGLSAADQRPFYRNDIEAIVHDVQFRPERITPKPRIYGTIQARIDKTLGLTDFPADINTDGTYKVKLPFDRPDPSASQERTGPRKVMMAQPYAGPDEGMQFPLRENTQILLTFMDGDPDRPVIAGAVPDNANQNILKDIAAGTVESTVSRIKTKCGNLLELEDKTGSEQIRIQSPGDIWLEAKNRYADYTVGAPPKTDTPGNLQYLHDKFYDAAGAFRPVGMEPYNYGTTAVPDHAHLDSWDKTTWTDLIEQGQIKMAKGDTFITQEGNIYDFGGYWNYNLGNCYIENHMAQKTTTGTDKAKLNETIAEDFPDIGGPGWGSLNWPADQGINSDTPLSGDWSNGNVWVEKKFGNSYDFQEGGAVSVQKGDTLDIVRGGKHIDVVYRSDGSIKSFSAVGGTWTTEEKKWASSGICFYHKTYHKEDRVGVENRITTETSWARETGVLASYSSKADYHITSNSFSYSAWNKHSAEIDFGSQASFSLKGAALASFDIYLAAKLSLDMKFQAVLAFAFSGGLDIDIGVWTGVKAKIGMFNGLDFEMKLGLAFAIELDFRVAGKLEKKGSGESKIEGVGFLLKKDVEAKVENRTATIRNGKMRLGKEEVDIAMGLKLMGL